MSEQAKKRPVHELRIGLVKAAIGHLCCDREHPDQSHARLYLVHLAETEWSSRARSAREAQNGSA